MGLPENVPFAVARRAAGEPTSQIADIAAEFRQKATGASYWGGGWVGDDGLPRIVVIDFNTQRIKQLDVCSEVLLICWRWDTTPACALTLTVFPPEKTNAQPHARWMRSSSDPIVQALKATGEFYFVVAHPNNGHTEWLRGSFKQPYRNRESGWKPFCQAWELHGTGIPESALSGSRQPDCAARADEAQKPSHPLWEDPVADFWATLDIKGPWEGDLDALDKAQAAWGREALGWRGRAAGAIQMVQERTASPTSAPLVHENGLPVKRDDQSEAISAMVRQHPAVGRWLGAIAGPNPSAQNAQLALLDVFRDPTATLSVLSQLDLLQNFGDEQVASALQLTFEAAVRDTSLTQAGTHRAWFENVEGGLALRKMEISTTADLHDIRELWRNGLDLIDLIETGNRVGPSDFPAPHGITSESLQSLKLEGSAEEAERRITSILREAQMARQWSIPWGARVEVAIGPFVFVRVFERDGEFSCHFLDEKERYHHVAIGLTGGEPRVRDTWILRPAAKESDVEWNEDAMIALQLVAAAIVRDFIVLEDREKLFLQRPLRRRVGNRKINSVVYLPRVRYSTPRVSSEAADAEAMASVPQAPHTVSGHLRKAAHASPAQRFLARKFGVVVPKGFTFVRPHERGSASEEAVLRTYRSRSASRMIFTDFARAPRGSRPEWFEFEKSCKRILERRGMSVVHQAANRDGDGGVDLFATASTGDGYVVQCKCWSTMRAVGPDVVREVAGAVELAGSGSATPTKGMIITTSRFTEGAASAASKLGIELVDGAQLAQMTP